MSIANPEVSVIVPARNEEACIADCLRSLVGQSGSAYDVIVVDDDSSDATRAIAAGFSVQVLAADPLPAGWSGKCNAVWAGAKAAKGKWLLFTDADTQHEANSIAIGLAEAIAAGAALLSYSPQQEVRGFAERALMPVIFAELAATYRPKDVSDPKSPAAAGEWPVPADPPRRLRCRRRTCRRGYDDSGRCGAREAGEAGRIQATVSSVECSQHSHVSHLSADVGGLDQESCAVVSHIRDGWRRCGLRSLSSSCSGHCWQWKWRCGGWIMSACSRDDGLSIRHFLSFADSACAF